MRKQAACRRFLSEGRNNAEKNMSDLKRHILLADDEATFRWDVRDGKLRVHTKSGGIITGEIEGDTLHVAMPGGKKMSFKKIE